MDPLWRRAAGDPGLPAAGVHVHPSRAVESPPRRLHSSRSPRHSRVALWQPPVQRAGRQVLGVRRQERRARRPVSALREVAGGEPPGDGVAADARPVLDGQRRESLRRERGHLFVASRAGAPGKPPSRSGARGPGVHGGAGPPRFDGARAGRSKSGTAACTARRWRSRARSTASGGFRRRWKRSATCTASDAPSVAPSAYAPAGNDLHAGVSSQPRGECRGLAVGQQIEHTVTRQVDQDGAVALALPPRPVVDAQHPHRRGRGRAGAILTRSYDPAPALRSASTGTARRPPSIAPTSAGTVRRRSCLAQYADRDAPAA